MFAIKAEVTDPRAWTFEFHEQKTMYGGKRISAGDSIFIFASENEGGSGLAAVGNPHLGQRDAEKARCGALNPACQHHRTERRPGEATARTKGAQGLFKLGGRQARDGVELQVLSSGHQQGRRPHSGDSEVPAWLFPAWRAGGWVTSRQRRLIADPLRRCRDLHALGTRS